MFSIIVESAFNVSGRTGIFLIGQTTFNEYIKVGSILTEKDDNTKTYKIKSIESARYKEKEKCLSHNPVVCIETDLNPSCFIGKTLLMVLG